MKANLDLKLKLSRIMWIISSYLKDLVLSRLFHQINFIEVQKEKERSIICCYNITIMYSKHTFGKSIKIMIYLLKNWYNSLVVVI